MFCLHVDIATQNWLLPLEAKLITAALNKCTHPLNTSFCNNTSQDQLNFSLISVIKHILFQIVDEFNNWIGVSRSF